MGKSTLKERIHVVNWLRENRLFIKNKGEIKDLGELKLAELEASFEYCLMWKKHISEMYDAVYAESRFIQDVRYYYRKGKWYGFRDIGANEPEFKELDFWSHQEYKRQAEKNNDMSKIYGFHDLEYRNRYFDYRVNGRTFKFELTEKHKDMLRRMDEINNLSQQAVKMLSTLRKQIDEIKHIAKLENSRIMGDKKTSEQTGGANGNDVKKD